MKPLKWLWLSLMVVSVVGCRSNDCSVAYTLSLDLTTMGRCFRRFSYEECVEAPTLAAMLKVASSKGQIHDVSCERMAKDWTGKPYAFHRTVDTEAVVIEIISVGHNGLFEAGNGDDIVLHVYVPRGGKASVDMKRDGRVITFTSD